MEKWIIRGVAALVALGALGLLWAFGMFTAVPVKQGRIFSPTDAELQLIGIPLVAGLLVGWGALHLFALADRQDHPRAYAAIRAVLLAAAAVAVVAGASWSLARVVG